MSKQLRVLVVEDNPADADLIRETLPTTGPVLFQLEFVSRLAEALTVLHRGGVDLVLLDLGLLDSQGLPTLQRTLEVAPDIPAIVLTGNDDEELALAAVKAGAQDYLVKGDIDAHILLRVARYAVERKRGECALRESERKLKEAQRLGRMGHWEFNLETRQIRWSDAVFALYERAPTLGPPTADEEAAYYSPEDAERLRAAARRTVETGDPYEIDVRLRLPGGRDADVVAIGAAVKDRDGEVVGLAGTLQDITKRKEAERRERLARDVLELLNTPTPDADPVREILRLVQESTGFDAVGIRLRAPDGDYPYYETSGFPKDFVEAERYLCGHDRAGNIMRGELGNPVLECMCGNVLCGRTDPAQPFFTEAGSFWTNSTTHLLATTTECERQGRTRNRCNSAGYESMTLIPLRSGSEVIGLLQLNDRRPDRLTRETVQFLEGLGASIGIALSRKRAEQHLLKLRKAVDSSGEVIFMTDGEGIITAVNPEFTRLYGYTAVEVVGKTTPRVLKSGTIGPEAYESFWRTLVNKQVAKGELVNKTKDGRLVPIESSANPILDSQGNAVGFLAIQRDISERKRAEEALRRSEADYRGLVEHASLGIYRAAPDGRLLTVNRALVAMLDYGSADELLRLSLPRDVYADPAERDHLLAQFKHEDMAAAEVQWKRKDGSLITARLSVRIVRARTGEIECFEGLAEDVTQQRSLENQFRQAQRLEAVGRLAGGVAHDFNNVLTAITGYSELLLEDLDPRDPKRQDVEEIRAAAQRAAALTRQLLAFSRKQVFQSRVLDLNTVVQTVDKMLQRLIGEDVKLAVSLGSALGAVRVDPTQIEQVILNLAVNARDAMPGGGRLTLETANVDLDEAYAREHSGASPGRYVMLAVSDTGSGMDTETQSHIFEPFFTTKEPGKGTGLGLATVYGIVKQSGGYLWVYSEPGHGAIFRIYLPRVDEPVEAQDMAPAAPPAAGGRETVLVAEDDPSVREVVSQVLAQKGYRVLRAWDGRTALEMARAQPGEIQLLVTDMVMPGMTGRELAEALGAERPLVRVLYMSGYTDDAVIRHRVLEEGMPYLQKPFTPSALAFKVRDVLDRPSNVAAAPF